MSEIRAKDKNLETNCREDAAGGPRDDDGLARIEEELVYEFRDRALLTLALTHRSFTNEQPGLKEDNQRLEFLGDAVLGLAIAETLMGRCPGVSEGRLTPLRASLVSEAALAQLALRVDLGEALRLGKGEEKTLGRRRPSTLADAVEAVIGAVYLDGGYEEARQVILAWFGDDVDTAVNDGAPGDPKTVLQEALQALGKMPEYRVVAQEGPDHAKVFEVEITSGDRTVSRGRGSSKKEAEKEAARRAIEEVTRWDEPLSS